MTVKADSKIYNHTERRGTDWEYFPPVFTIDQILVRYLLFSMLAVDVFAYYERLRKIYTIQKKEN